MRHCTLHHQAAHVSLILCMCIACWRLGDYVICTTGIVVLNTRCGFSPSWAAATAMILERFDWMPPQVMMLSQPLWRASAIRNSSWRICIEISNTNNEPAYLLLNWKWKNLINITSSPCFHRVCFLSCHLSWWTAGTLLAVQEHSNDELEWDEDTATGIIACNWSSYVLG